MTLLAHQYTYDVNIVQFISAFFAFSYSKRTEITIKFDALCIVMLRRFVRSPRAIISKDNSFGSCFTEYTISLAVLSYFAREPHRNACHGNEAWDMATKNKFESRKKAKISSLGYSFSLCSIGGEHHLDVNLALYAACEWYRIKLIKPSWISSWFIRNEYNYFVIICKTSAQHTGRLSFAWLYNSTWIVCRILFVWVAIRMVLRSVSVWKIKRNE